jgi:hypothetical protein
MRATGLMHLRRPPTSAVMGNVHTWVLSLVERVGARSYEAQVEAAAHSDAARAWVVAHRAELRAGVSLRVELEDIHARDGVLRGFFREAPEIAPPRYPVAVPAAASLSPSQAAPA